MFFVEVIKRTPLYVWVILIVLLKRGVSSAKDGRVSFPKMILIPAVFVIWGLEKLITRFQHPGAALFSYIIMAGIGAAAGYGIYSRCRSFYKKEGEFYRTGSYIPLAIIMINFLIKYVLNVVAGILPGLYECLAYNIIYAVLCGFSTGLLIGNVICAYVSCICRQAGE